MDIRRIKIIVFLIVLFLIPSFSHVYGATLSKPANNLGLVGYWSFNEGTSTSATDFSGRRNTGILTNIAAPASATSGWGSGKLGGGLKFDGSNDWVEVANSSAFGITGDITISAWIKRNTNNDYGGILSKGNGTDRWDYEFYICGDSQCGANNFLGFYNDAPAGNVQSTGEITDTNWHHVVVTRSGSTVTFYIDGVSSGGGTKSGAFNNNSDPIRIGTDGPGWNAISAFNGSIDEVRLYNRSLTATEIRNLYNSGSARINSSQNNLVKNGLIGYWTFDSSNFSDKVYDLSGNGHNGYFIGGATSSAKTIGKTAQAISFDGSNDSVLIAHSSLLDLDMTESATFSFWINKTSASANAGPIYKRTSGSAGYSIDILTTGAVSFSIGDLFGNNNRISNETSTTMNLNQWYHVVVTYDGSITSSGIKIYFDGVLQSLTNPVDNHGGGSSSNGIDFSLGARESGTSRQLHGKMDEVRFYNRVLSGAEINLLYRAGESKINASQNSISGSSLNSGLIGMWSFNSRDLSDKVYDRSGNGNDGYFNGRATSSAKTIGKVGQALDFDGTTDSVYLGTPASLFPTSAITMSAWIKPDLSGAMLVVANDDAATISNQMRTQGAGTRCSINSTNSTQGSSLVVGEWTHIACVYDGANIINYINGVNVGSTALTGSISYANSNTEPWRIGRRGDAAPGYFDGKIDEVRIYNRGLTALEIKQIYLLGR